MDRRGRRLKFLLALLSVSIGLVVSEAVLRIVRPPAVGFARQPAVYRQDEEIGYRYAPGAVGRIHRNFEMDNVVRFNSRGFHDEERDADRPGFRVLAVGDSFTAAIHVTIEQTWTQVLQSELRAAGIDADVVNLGLDGTGSDIHLALLERHAAELRPDLVIVAFTDNDLTDVVRERIYRDTYRDHVLAFTDQAQAQRMRELVDRKLEGSRAAWLHDRLYLFRLATSALQGRGNLLRSNFVRPSHVGGSISSAGRTEDLDRVFGEFRRLADTLGFRLIVVPVPMKRNPGRSAELFEAHVRRADLQVIDVRPGMRERLARDGRSWRDLYWKYDGHFNAYGNEAFATALAEAAGDRLAPEASKKNGGSRGATAEE